jgi:nitronate monooxygenase
VAPASSRTALSTSLCELLGVRYPLVQAPMASGWTTPELVAAVSQAGGFGCLAGAGVPPERLRDDIRAVKERTDRPFGVNFLLAPPGPGSRDVAAAQRFLDGFRERFGLPAGDAEIEPQSFSLEEQVEVVFEERVPVLSVALGDPGELVGRAHERGMLVMSMATTVGDAVRAVEGRADVVVAQGAEAGGHRSVVELGPGGEVPLVGTLALVPQVVDAVGVPVVAAGGVSDGRGLVAALALGAAGVQMGTRFLLARESGAHPVYRRRLLAATEEDTVVTRVFTGRHARALRSRFVEEYASAGAEPLAWPLQRAAAGDIYKAAQAANDGDHSPLLAGQGLRMLREDGQGAAEIVDEVVAEAGAVLSRLAGESEGVPTA